MKSSFCWIGLVLVAIGATTNLSAAELTGVDLKFINDSNPAKAEFDRDIEATSSVLGRLTASLYSLPLADTDLASSGLSLSGSASFEHNLDIEGLGESRYRLGMSWFRESKKSAGSPLVRLSLGAGYLDSQTEIRDSLLLDVGGSINFQPTNFFDTTFGLQTEVRDAETDVFDTTKTTLFVTANFSPIPRLVFRTGLRFVAGNEVSTATPTLNIVNSAEFIEPDEAFGGAPAQRFAYLIDADSTIAEAGVGYGFSGTVQANLLYRFVSTEADGDISYERSLIEFTVSLDL